MNLEAEALEKKEIEDEDYSQNTTRAREHGPGLEGRREVGC